MGHDAKLGHHVIYTADPDSFELKFIADIGGDMHVDMLGTSSAYDCDSKQVYVSIAYNNSTPRPAIKMVAVSIASGAVVQMRSELTMAGMVYDSKSKRVYGTRVESVETGAEVSPWMGAVLVRGTKGITPRSTIELGATLFHRFLSYFDATNLQNASLVDVAQYHLTAGVGDLHTLDRVNRVHYTLMLDNPPFSPPYKHSDYCEKHGNQCPTGSTCCRAPTSKVDYGICYAVPTCARMPPSVNPLNVSNFLVGVSIDTGTLVSKVPVCSMEPSAGTVDAPCPWSVESAFA